MRSSSLPVFDGTPAVRMILPPSPDTSVARKPTSRSSIVDCTVEMSSWRASAATAGPSSAMSASVPLELDEGDGRHAVLGREVGGLEAAGGA